MIHELKTYSPEFQAIVDCLKTFEIRKEDGHLFNVDDVLELREYDSVNRLYTGRVVQRTITYIMRGPRFGLPAGYVAMAIVGENRHPHTTELFEKAQGGFNEVAESLNELYHVWARSASGDIETVEALDKLMKIYDEWLD